MSCLTRFARPTKKKVETARSLVHTIPDRFLCAFIWYCVKIALVFERKALGTRLFALYSHSVTSAHYQFVRSMPLVKVSPLLDRLSLFPFILSLEKNFIKGVAAVYFRFGFRCRYDTVLFRLQNFLREFERVF